MKIKYEKLGNGSKQVKIVHTERILNALYNGDYSVVELAKMIGVSHPTTKSIIEELRDNEIVVKSDVVSEKSVGRPLVRYTLNNRHGVFVCINFERYDSSYYIFDFHMNELSKRKLKLTNYDIDDLDSIIMDIKTDLKLLRCPLLYVTVAMVGGVDKQQGVVVSSLFDTNLKGFDFKRYISKELNTPVFLDNDTRIASIGELKEGDFKKYSDLIYLQIAGGVSSVIYCQGEPVGGDFSLLGEVGLTSTETGRTLHYECTVRSLIERLGDNLEEASTKGLIEGIKTNKVVHDLVMKSGEILGKTLMNMSYLTGIKNFALAGKITNMPEEYFQHLKKGCDIVYEYYPEKRDMYDLNILISTSENPIKLGLKYLAKSLYISSLTASI